MQQIEQAELEDAFIKGFCDYKIKDKYEVSGELTGWEGSETIISLNSVRNT